MQPIGILFQNVGQTKADSRMTIMSAGVHHPRVTGGKVLAERAVVAVAMFIQIEGIHIDPKGQRGAGTPGIQRRDDTGEAAFKRAQPRFWRPLLAGALKSFGQGGLIR